MALRPLRDLIREVPIAPRFLYGDVVRGVMRLALKREPGERAGAPRLTAAIEDITKRFVL